MSGGKHPYRYGAFGLRVASALPLPELFAIDDDGEPDVRIDCRRDAGLAKDEETAGDVRGDGSVWFDLEGIHYEVTAKRIDIAAPEETDAEDIRVWLLGTVISALLLQRGMIVLHANSVALTNGEAAAFLGESGDGKSTLAAALSTHGRRVLCDDLLGIEVGEGGEAWIRPGIPRVKLGPAGAAALGIDLSDAPRVAVDIDKYQMQLDRTQRWDERFRLTRLYKLARGPLDIAPAQGRVMGKLIVENIFRPGLDAAIEGQGRRFAQAMALGNLAAGFTFTRPFDLATIDDSTAALMAHLDTPL